jgi:MFS family permease
MQNLIWGLAQPFAGALADRHGPGKVLLGADCCMHWACC